MMIRSHKDGTILGLTYFYNGVIRNYFYSSTRKGVITNKCVNFHQTLTLFNHFINNRVLFQCIYAMSIVLLFNIVNLSYFHQP